MILGKVNPVIMAGLSVVGCMLLFVTTGTKVTENSQLNQSLVFQKILECTDIVDGNSCFKDNKQQLIDEFYLKNKFAHDQWESCINVIGDNSDINILLNIQKCYHQADLVSKITDNGAKYLMIVLGINMLIQVIVAIHIIIGYAIRNSDHNDQIRTVAHVKEAVKTLDRQVNVTIEKVSNLEIQYTAAIKNVMGRLNRGGDIKRELEFLRSNYYEFNNEMNKFKIEFFSKIGRDFFVLPPTASPGTTPTSIPSSINSNPGPISGTGPIVSRPIAGKPQKSTEIFTPPKKSSRSIVGGAKSEPKASENIPPRFDILTASGRELFKHYLQNQNQNQPLKYKDVNRIDPATTKRYKRVFIRNRGWVSLKQLESEETQYGLNNVIVHQSLDST